jgi:hypothetical protein
MQLTLSPRQRKRSQKFFKGSMEGGSNRFVSETSLQEAQERRKEGKLLQRVGRTLSQRRLT